MFTSREDRLVAALVIVWAGLFAWSFIDFMTTEATGDGFTRGFNRIAGFLLWQFAAGIVSVPAYLTGRAHPRGSPVRWISRLPLAVSVLLLVAMVGLILIARAGG